MTPSVRKSRSLLEIAHYTAISCAALVLDYSVYWLLLSTGQLSIGPAAAAGYSIGLVFAYLIMSDQLFKDGWLSGHRAKEAGLFALSGLIGIALSYVVAEAYNTFVQNNIYYAKLSATLICFVIVYAFRKCVVFRRAPSRKPLA